MVLVTALGIAACAPPPPPSLEVEYAGCHTVLRGSVCVVPGEDPLRLWVRADPGADLEITAGGKLLDVEERAAGRLLEVEPDGQQPELVLRLSAAGGEATWSLALRRNDEPSWLVEARTLDPEVLASTRQQVTERVDGGLEAGLRGPALRVLARLAARTGDPEAARDHTRQALKAHRSDGDYLEEIECRASLSHWLLFDNQLSDARAILDDMPDEGNPPAEALFHRAYSRAVLAHRFGDHQTALRLLDGAARQAERVELVRYGRMARELQAVQLQLIGRDVDAAAILKRLWDSAPENERPCDRASLANNIGWSRLRVLEAGGDDTDPMPWLEEALDIFQQQCPALVDEPANVHTNLARANLHGGRRKRAREHLESSRRQARSPEIRQRLWWRDVEARIALGEGRAERALELYDDMASLATATLSAEAEWRSALGRGRAHQALGRIDSARRDFARGEALLDGASLQVSISAGRADFVAQRELGTRFYIELLLDQNLERDAFEIARRSRSRILRSLRRSERLAHLEPERRRRWDETVAAYHSRRQQLDVAMRDAWRLPADELRRLEVEQAAWRRELNDLLDRFLGILEPSGQQASALPPLAPGEVRLVFHPLPQGWAAFAEDAGDLQVERLPELVVEAPGDALAASELARHLLEPFAAKIAGAEQVRILPYGDLRAVDFHQLPFGGDVLLASKPVVYGLDLQPTTATPERRPKRGVVVVDPGGDLAGARLEARHVRKALTRGWSIDLLEGAAADGDAVRAALAAADLFHYAGHGVFAGWESALPLAAGSRLTLGDVLVLERPPVQVVLSGCDTGRSAAVPADAAGLAHAFLAAGSRSVIAATRPIADDTALALTSALYPALVSSASAPAALRQAQLELRRRDPGADWSSFRVFEP